jgi:D-aminoacyl-tRNA deacylase
VGSLLIQTKVAIIVPKQDLAANTIWKMLENNSYFKESNERFDQNPVYEYLQAPNEIKLVHSNKDGVESNHLDRFIDADFFIFASRHRAASGTPALLIHPTGNWFKVTLGGNEKELAYTSGLVLKQGLENLQSKREEYNLYNFKVDLEVTHHGPTELKTPLIFMELGSNEENWKDETAALAVGEAIIRTAENFLENKNFSGDCFIGVGGNHYAYRFHKYILENENAFVSHIVAKHSLDNLSENILSQAFTKSIESPTTALIDKKGARSEQRKNVISLLSKLGKKHILI